MRSQQQQPPVHYSTGLCLTPSARSLPPPLLVASVVRESGGKMYLRDSRWQQAYDAFFSAFRGYQEAGHVRAKTCLKCGQTAPSAFAPPAR